MNNECGKRIVENVQENKKMFYGEVNSFLNDKEQILNRANRILKKGVEDV